MYVKKVNERLYLYDEDNRYAKNQLKEDYFVLTKLLTKFHNSKIPIFPVFCPVCNSSKMTVVIGTGVVLECLDCHAQFELRRKNGKN